MEAKDTVMKAGDLCLKVCQEHRSRTLEAKNCDGLDCEKCQLEAQAEISFKAGIREMVDFIEKAKIAHASIIPPINTDTEIVLVRDIKAKLKALGLE